MSEIVMQSLLPMFVSSILEIRRLVSSLARTLNLGFILLPHKQHKSTREFGMTCLSELHVSLDLDPASGVASRESPNRIMTGPGCLSFRMNTNRIQGEFLR